MIDILMSIFIQRSLIDLVTGLGKMLSAHHGWAATAIRFPLILVPIFSDSPAFRHQRFLVSGHAIIDPDT